MQKWLYFRWASLLPLLAACEQPLTVPPPPSTHVPGRVTGRVLLGTESLAGARVELPFAGFTALTAADGRFQLTNVPEGSQRLVVEARRDGALLVARAPDAAVFSGRPTDVGDLVLEASGSVAGRIVTGAATGNSGGLVFVAFSDRVAVTSDDGSFVLGGLGAGEVVLDARLAGFAAGRVTVPVGVGGTSENVAIPLAPVPSVRRGVLSGRVLLADGANPSGTLVMLEGTGLASSADAKGAWRFDAVPEDAYAVAFVRDGYARLRVRAVPVDADSPTTVPDVTLRLTNAADLDSDGIADAEDEDLDGDGWCQVATAACAADAFPLDPEEWGDADRDGLGDRADPDDDNDTLADAEEESPGVDGWLTDPLRADTDADGRPDADDAFPLDSKEIDDFDRDGVGDVADNCLHVPNPNQADVDTNGLGDACDGDGVNHDPVLAFAGPTAVDEGEEVVLVVTATDVDGDPLSLVAREVPAGAVFTDDGGGAGTLRFRPDFTQAGSHLVRVAATDGRAVVVATHALTVWNRETADLPPTLTIGGRTTWSEGELVALTVRAIDSESRPLTLSVRGAPAAAIFVDAGDGTGTFTWPSTHEDAAIHPLEFVATNGEAETARVVELVLENVNRAPQLLGPARVQAFAGRPVSFQVAAADPDGDPLTLTIQGDSTGITLAGSTVTYVPPEAATGTDVTITIVASDGLAELSTRVVVSVHEAPNALPVIAVTGSPTVDEGATLTLSVVASDADPLQEPALSVRGLPAGASFTNTGAGAGTLSFTPDFAQAGVHPVTFVATDGRATTLLDRVLTVVDVPLPPAIQLSGALAVAEGERLLLTVRATDPDRQPLVLTARHAPPGAQFLDLGNGTGTLSWTPGYADAGSHPVELAATAGTREALVSETIVVSDVNRAPSLAVPERVTVSAGTVVRIPVEVSDPDGLVLVPQLVAPPEGAVYANGEITWTPPGSAVGTEVAIELEVSDGPFTVRARCLARVVALPNRAPSLAVPPTVAVDEGQLLSVTLTATDPDGDALTFGALGLPAAARVRPVSAGEAVLEWTPGFTDAGAHAAGFFVSDGQLSTFVERLVTVRNVAQPPLLTIVGSRTASEGMPLTLDLRAIDYDGRPLTLGVRDAPADALFTDGGDGHATFTWLTRFSDAGTHAPAFFARAGTDEAVVPVVLTISDVNRPPALVAPARVDVVAATEARVALAADDPDGTAVMLSLPGSPPGAAITGTTLVYTPPGSAAGTEVPVVVRASDGAASVEVTVRFTVVSPPNRLPTITVSGPVTGDEGATLTNAVSATDPDGDAVTLFTGVLPARATFTPGAAGTGTLEFKPDFTQAGSHTIVLGASDGRGVTQLSRVLVIADVAGDTPPVLTVGGPETVDEGAAADFNLFATDAEGHAISLSLAGKPATAVFTDRGGGLGTLRWATGFADAGTYSLVFKATANGVTVTRTVTLVVRNVNRAPVLPAIDARTIALGSSAVVNLAATDADGDALTLAFSPARAGASLSGSGGSGTFTFTPVAADVGTTISFDFTVSDGVLAATRTLVATVTGDANQAPVWAAVADQTVDEGQVVVYEVRATDPNGTVPTVVATSLPVGASLVDLGGGVGRITFGPHFDLARRTDPQSRKEFLVGLEARDGATATALAVKFIVRNVNRTPTLLDQPDVTAGAGAKVVVNATAADADPDDTLTYAFDVSPQTLPFTVTTNRLSLEPAHDQAPGAYTVTIRARDDLLAAAVDTFTFTVVAPDWFRLETGAGPAMGRGVMLVDPIRSQLVAFDPWRAPEAVYLLPYGSVTDPRALTWTARVLPGTAGTTLPPAGLQFRAVYDPTRGVILLVQFDGDSLKRRIWKLSLTPGAETWSLYSSTHPFPPGADPNVEAFAIDGPTDRFVTMTGYNYPAYVWNVETLAQVTSFAPNSYPTAMQWAVSDHALRLSFAPSGNCLTPYTLAKYVLGPTASRTFVGYSATAPLMRLGSAAAIDAARNRLLVYGGQASAGCFSNVTSSVDLLHAFDLAANTWSNPLANRPPPPARAGAQMAVIPGKNWVVVQGGCSSLAYMGTCTATNTTLNDTWIGELADF